MSLVVYAYQLVPKTNSKLSIDEQPKAPFNDLFGSESWRNTVWNSPILRQLECTLLNSLSVQDIYASNDKLLQLKNELKLVKQHIVLITKELNLDRDSFEFRVDNALEAVRIAQKVTNGIVYIG